MKDKIKLPIDEIIKLYTIDKYSAVKIAKLYNVSNCTVGNRLKESNVLIRKYHQAYNKNSTHKRIFSKSEIQNIVNLYTIKHQSSVDIGKLYNTSFSTILRLLRDENIPITDSRHDKRFAKLVIKQNEIPSIIKKTRTINYKLTGEVTCPICHKTRRLTLTRPRIKDIVKSNGRCQNCSHSTVLDINKIRKLYTEKRHTLKYIGNLYHVAVPTIKQLLQDSNVPLRKRGELKMLTPNNKGTVSNPEIGDIRKGTEIGLQNNGYYLRVTCDKCGLARWECKSRVNKLPLCKPCAMKLNGERHRGENSTYWHGGKSFEPYGLSFTKFLREEIRQRDNYTCQMCGAKQNGIKLAVHHIDYNKNNNNPKNLISLCTAKKGKHINNTSCHAKTNGNRDYWTQYFTSLLKSQGIT
jgi:predicted DNA-binding protein YlxM (UPF0122 family)